MGQNQVKKQQKYGEFDVKVEQLELEFQDQRKNKFAEERSRDVEHLYYSEQPRVKANPNLRKSDMNNAKRSISTEKAYQTFKFQKEQKKQQNQDPVIKKIREINRCQDMADFFLRMQEVIMVNISLVHNVPMNFNIMGCQQRQEEAVCSTKKAQTTQFVQYLEEKAINEVERISKINFEDVKAFSSNFLPLDIDEQYGSKELSEFDIFQQDKSKFKTSTRIERNKNNKETEVSKIIQSRRNENSIYIPINENDSNIKNRKQSQIKSVKKQSFNDYEEAYLELASDRLRNDRFQDNQELLSNNPNNRLKLSQIVKNNSEQASSYNSQLKDKNNGINQPHYKSDIQNNYNKSDNQPFQSQKQNTSKISDPSKRPLQTEATKYTPFISEEESKLVTFNVNPDEYTKFNSQNAQPPNQNSSLLQNSNKILSKPFNNTNNNNNSNIKNGQHQYTDQYESKTPNLQSIVSDSNKKTHVNSNIYENPAVQSSNIHNNYNYSQTPNFQNNGFLSERTHYQNLQDPKVRMKSNLDFQEPQLVNIKSKSNNIKNQKAQQNSALLIDSENISSNFLEEGSPVTKFQDGNQKPHDHTKMFTPSMQQSKIMIKDNFNVSQQYQQPQSNNYNNPSKINNNDQKYNQQVYITPQKESYSSVYIDSTNIGKKQSDPLYQNQDSYIDYRPNNFDNQVNGSTPYQASSNYPTQFNSNIKNDTKQRSRTNSNHNFERSFQYNNNNNNYKQERQQEEKIIPPQSNIFIPLQKDVQGNQNNSQIIGNNAYPTNNINNNSSNNYSNNSLNAQGSNSKVDQQKDQQKKKIIQLGGKTQQRSSIQGSQSKNKNMDSPYKPRDEQSLQDVKQQKQIKDTMNLNNSRQENNQSRYYTNPYEHPSTSNLNQVNNIINYLPNNQEPTHSNHKKSSQQYFQPNDKNNIQSLLQQRNQQKRVSEDDHRLNNNPNQSYIPESSKMQSPNLQPTNSNNNLKRFYESKHEQLERLSNTKQSNTSSQNRNERSSSQQPDINKYLLSTSSTPNRKVSGNVGIQLQKLNKTQHENSDFNNSHLLRTKNNRLSGSSISPSKFTQMIVKEKESKFDDSFINKDYSEFSTAKIGLSSQNQTNSYSHIKSLIQESQANVQPKNKLEEDNLWQKSRLDSKIKQQNNERYYSPMSSNVFIPTQANKLYD